MAPHVFILGTTTKIRGDHAAALNVSVATFIQKEGRGEPKIGMVAAEYAKNQIRQNLRPQNQTF
jgi:hypothetical protein